MAHMLRTLLICATALLTPGCLVVSAADLAVGATGAVIGTAGEVVEGAVDVVTPGKEDDPKTDTADTPETDADS